MATFRSLLALAALLPLMELRAQSSDTPWAAFVGCWQPIDDDASDAASTTGGAMFSTPITCIVPDAEQAFAAQLITTRGGETLRTVTLLADGTRVSRTDAQCTGWDVASFSDDGARIYLTGETTCGASAPVRTSGIMTLLPNGTRLMVSGTQTPEGERLRVERSSFSYGRGLNGAMADALLLLTQSTGQARFAASRALRLSDVMEASARVQPSVTEVWIAEAAIASRGASVQPNQSDLRALAAANVPGRVIDMLVAAANPTYFRVAIAEDGASAAELVSSTSTGATSNAMWDGAGWAGLTGLRGISGAQCARIFDAFALAAFGFGPRPDAMIGQNGRLAECYGYSGFGVFGPFGGLGWSQYGRYFGDFQGNGRRPIRVVVNPVTGGAPRPVNGRVVRGQGYTTGGEVTPNGGRAQPREGAVRSPRPAESAASPPRPARSPASIPSGESAPSSSAGGSESGGRTAKPRTP